MKNEEKHLDSADLTPNAQGADLNLLIKAKINQFFNLKSLEDKTFRDAGFINLLMKVIEVIKYDQSMIHSLAAEVGTSPEFIIKIVDELYVSQANILGVIEPKSDL